MSLTDEGELKAEEISNQMLEYLGNIFQHIQEDKHQQVMESLSLLLYAMNKNNGLGSCATK